MVIGMLGLTGCGKSHNTVVVDPGEKVVVDEKVQLMCGEPFSFQAVSQYEGNVTVQLPESDPIEYAGNVGVDVKYTVVSDCEQAQVPVKPVDGECPTDYVLDEDADMCFPKKDEVPTVPVPDEDGKCPSGYKITDCNTCVALPACSCGEGTISDPETNQCVVAPEPVNPCGEGTVLDPETEQCLPVPPKECEDGFGELNSTCVPIRYIPYFDKADGYSECIEGYTWKSKNELCRLTSDMK